LRRLRWSTRAALPGFTFQCVMWHETMIMTAAGHSGGHTCPQRRALAAVRVHHTCGQ
jgi:hypothetical protein